MAITEISRDWGQDPAIVRITATDSLAVALGATYLTDQATNIEAINHGVFKWKDGDAVLLYHSGGTTLLTYDITNNTLSGGDMAIAVSTVVTITSAELLALAAAPKELVAAPGAGLLARFENIELFLDFNTTAYTITAGGDDLAVRYTDGAGAIVSQTMDSAGFMDAAADAYLQGEAIDEVGGDLVDHANQSLVLDNIGANEFTLGDSPVYARVNYRLIAVPF